MAIYQFVIELVPRSWAKINKYNIELLFEDNMYDVSSAWKKCIFTKKLEEQISSILPKAKTWSAELFIWGNEENNDIQVSINVHEEIESIRIRLDLRENINRYLDDIVSLAKSLECLLFSPEHRKIFETDHKLLVDYIDSSNARKFVNRPHEYLNTIAKKENKDK